MAITTFTQEIKARLIRLLADGNTAEEVAEELGCERDQVVAIARNHGYPDRDRLAWAADVMEKKPAGVPPVAARPQPAAPAPTAAPSSAPDIGALLRAAKDHPSKRIQSAAAQIVERISKLRDLMAEDAEKNAEKRKAEAEREAARAEVRRLEQQLADAKAKLRPTKPAAAAAPPAAGEPTAAEVRAWDASAGVDCPKSGRVPESVRTAYADAQIKEAS